MPLSEHDRWGRIGSPGRIDCHQPTDAWRGLTRAQQMFYAMAALEGQVSNGGFHQLYFNGCGWLAEHALAGYEAIGASEHASIVRNVIETLRRDPWAGPPEVWPDGPDSEPPAGEHFDIGIFDEPWWALDSLVLDAAKTDFIAASTTRFPPSTCSPN